MASPAYAWRFLNCAWRICSAISSPNTEACRLPPPRSARFRSAQNTEAQMFIRGLKQGEFNVVLFETGVGVRYLVEATETRLPLEDWPQLLARVVVIARGPKPASAVRSLSALSSTSKSLSRTPGGKPSH